MNRLKTIVQLALAMESVKEGSPQHRQLVDDYNNILPHPRGYKLKYTDAWCAAYVSVIALASGVTTFPAECGVTEMREKLHEQGCLIRGRLPFPGEIVFYRYSHVGFCYGCNPANGDILVVAGNTNDKVKCTKHNIRDGQLAYFASPWRYSWDDVASQVIAGWYGNGEDRYNALTENGYNYQSIQCIVNERLGHGVD